MGYLNVTIPPDILNDEDGFSDGYQALEGGTIHLRCRAVGEPKPEVSWKREDGKPIVLRNDKQIGSKYVSNFFFLIIIIRDPSTHTGLFRFFTNLILNQRRGWRSGAEELENVCDDRCGVLKS